MKQEINLPILRVEKLIGAIDSLKNSTRFSAEHTRWTTATKKFFRDEFGETSDHYLIFESLKWSKKGVIGGPARPRESMNPQLGVDRLNSEAYQEQLETARGLLLAAKDELKDVKEDKTKFTPPTFLKTLDDVLVQKIEPNFSQGHYNTAIFEAFKEVEIRVRKKGGYENKDYGVALMRKAFHPITGKLTNTKSEPSEKQAMSDLFAGSVGLFKNPVSHRDIADITKDTVTKAIGLADLLLHILDD